MYNPVETGNRIRECRQTKHLTQEQAAEALSISIKHYSEIERGITGLSFEIFIKSRLIPDYTEVVFLAYNIVDSSPGICFFIKNFRRLFGVDIF